MPAPSSTMVRPDSALAAPRQRWASTSSEGHTHTFPVLSTPWVRWEKMSASDSRPALLRLTVTVLLLLLPGSWYCSNTKSCNWRAGVGAVAVAVVVVVELAVAVVVEAVVSAPPAGGGGGGGATGCVVQCVPRAGNMMRAVVRDTIQASTAPEVEVDASSCCSAAPGSAGVVPLGM